MTLRRLRKLFSRGIAHAYLDWNSENLRVKTKMLSRFVNKRDGVVVEPDPGDLWVTRAGHAKELLMGYGVSLVVYFFAFLLTQLLWPFITPAPVPLFFAAIIAAFWGGFGPGLFISVVSALTIDFFFVAPFDHFEWTSQNLVRIGVFIAVSSLVSWLNGTRKRLMDERGKLLVQIEGFNEDLRREVALATQDLGRANDALLRTQQHLARSERLAVVGQMAASLAHEIGTPLNAISGHLELLADNHSNASDTRRRVRIIRQQLDFIVGTVKRLLEWTHKRNTAPQPVNLRKLIQEVLWLVGPTLEEHSISARLNSEDQLPTINANRESLQQVFLNLINNSIDAMPGGGALTVKTGLAHLDEKYAKMNPGVLVGDHVCRGNGSVCAKECLQILLGCRVGQSAHVDPFCHARWLLSFSEETMLVLL